MKLLLICLAAVAVVLAAEEDEKLPENYESIIKNAAADVGTTNILEWSPDIATWEPSEYMKKELPYYLMGYDYQHRPILVMEFGRWDARKFIDAGGQNYTDFDKYFEQFWFRLQNETSPHPEADDGVNLLIDCNNFSARQLASIEVVRNQLIQARRAEKVEPRVVNFWIVNMNFIAQTWTSLIRPVAGRLMGKAELYSTNKDKYAAALSEKIPKEQIPEWYGGSKDFKPAKIY